MRLKNGHWLYFADITSIRSQLLVLTVLMCASLQREANLDREFCDQKCFGKRGLKNTIKVSFVAFSMESGQCTEVYDANHKSKSLQPNTCVYGE